RRPPPSFFPAAPANFAYTARLMRSQNRELDPLCRQGLQRLHVNGGFRQPHAFWRASKTMLKITNAPYHLRKFVAGAGQWQDHVFICLRYRRAMSGETLLALPVGFKDAFISFGNFF